MTPRAIIMQLPGTFPSKSEWTIYGAIPGVQPWRVVILSADRKREAIGTGETLIAAYNSAMEAWS